MYVRTLEEEREMVRGKPEFEGIRKGVTAMSEGMLPKTNIRKKKGKKSKAKRKTKGCGCK